MQKLSAKEIAALSHKERSLLNSLGISLESLLSKKARRRDRGKRATCSNPYILVATSECRLCKSKEKRIFEMQKRGDFLLSEEIAHIPPGNEVMGMKVKHSHTIVRHCNNCLRFLVGLSKEDLVHKFIEHVRDIRNYV